MVIQRWQSVLLLIAVVLMCFFSFCELASIQGATQTVNAYSYGIYEMPQGVKVVDSIYVTIVAMLAAVLSFINIFMFKNTRLQKRLCQLCMVLVIAAVLSDYLVINSLDIPGATGVPFFSQFFIDPLTALLALIGARRLIRKDELRLSSADRLR